MLIKLVTARCISVFRGTFFLNWCWWRHSHAGLPVAMPFNVEWFSRAEGAVDRSDRIGFRLQQLEVCQSLWHHKHIITVCVITLTVRWQKFHTTGLRMSLMMLWEVDSVKNPSVHTGTRRCCDMYLEWLLMILSRLPILYANKHVHHWEKQTQCVLQLRCKLLYKVFQSRIS